jgi:hypothetical protein
MLPSFHRVDESSSGLSVCHNGAVQVPHEPIELHALSERVLIGTRAFVRCSCGWTSECVGDWPLVCRVDEAEVDLAWRIGLARAAFAESLTRIQAVSDRESAEVQRLAGVA